MNEDNRSNVVIYTNPKTKVSKGIKANELIIAKNGMTVQDLINRIDTLEMAHNGLVDEIKKLVSKKEI